MQKIGCLGVIVVVLLAGCQPRGPEAPHATSALPAEPVPAAVAVSTQNDSRYMLGGEGGFSLGALKGRVVLLDVMAAWSEPCRRDVPALNRLHEEYAAQGLAVVGLAVDREPAAQVQAALQQAGVIYPVAEGRQGTLQALGGVRALPTRILLDRKGVVRQTFAGAVPFEEVRTNVLALLRGDG